MVVKFKSGEKMTILKVGNAYPNCVKEHVEVINQTGKCWMARLGKDVASQPMMNPQGYFVLYDKGTVYLSHYSEKLHEKPENNYPPNYDRLFYKRNVEPYEYLLIDKITEIDGTILNELKYAGNQRTVSETISITPKGYMSVFFTKDFQINI